MKLFLVLLTLAVATKATSLKKSNEVLPEFQCITDPGGASYRCHFDDIYTTKENPNFQPFHPHAEDIIAIAINTGNQMEILTSDICDYFPNLRDLWINDVKLQGFEDGALLTCTNLNELTIWQGLFNELPEDLFKGSQKLAHVTIRNTPLIRILPNTFSSLPKLASIFITKTLIEEFPVESIVSSELSSFILYSNNLKDLAVERLVEQSPKLRIINFNDNDIKCSIVSEILSVLEKRPAIQIQYLSARKEREEVVGEVGRIICIP